MNLKCAMAFCLYIVTTNIVSAQSVIVTGLGASSCQKYIIDTVGNEYNEKLYFAWAQGFMNGALVRAPIGVDTNVNLAPNGFSVPMQMIYLKEWCKVNIDSDFSDASFALFNKLRSHNPR